MRLGLSLHTRSECAQREIGTKPIIPTGVNDDSSFTPVGMRAGLAGRPRAKERRLYQRSFFMTVGISKRFLVLFSKKQPLAFAYRRLSERPGH
jgi:hypothetical protein